MVVNPISNLAHVGTVRAETRMLCRLVFGSPAASQCWLGHDANVSAGFSCDDCAAKQGALQTLTFRSQRHQRRHCAWRCGGAFTSDALVPCPAPAASKPHMPGWTNTAENQTELSGQKKKKQPKNVPYSLKPKFLIDQMSGVVTVQYGYFCASGIKSGWLRLEEQGRV